VVSDVSIDPLFAPYLSVASANGFRAVQSTPIFALDGSVTGMLSTHFAEVHLLSESEEFTLDKHAAAISRLTSDFLGVKVELRNHPSICFAGQPSWPPVWTPTTKRDGGKAARGEIGILVKAYTTSDAAKTCYLIIEHKFETYVGALMLEDAAFCQRLCSIIQQNAGRTIAEIGSIDLRSLELNVSGLEP
jgi:hypothetical protein